MQEENVVDRLINSILRGENIEISPSAALLNDILSYFIANTTFTSIDFHNRMAIPPTAKDAFLRTFGAPKKGGTCFQINGALYHVLTTIGYTTTLYPARVKAEGSTRFDFQQDSHMALAVTLADKVYLVDPGWGNIPERILSIDGGETVKGKGRFQAITIGQKIAFQLFINSEAEWVTQFEFEMNTPFDYPEFELLNKFAQSADYVFQEDMFTLKMTPNGLYFLQNCTLELISPDGKKEFIDIETLGGIKSVLRDIFKLSDEYLADFNLDTLPSILGNKLKPYWITDNTQSYEHSMGCSRTF